MSSHVKQMHVLSLLQAGMTTIDVVFHIAEGNNSDIGVPLAKPKTVNIGMPGWADFPADSPYAGDRGRPASPRPPMPEEARRFTYKVKVSDNIESGQAVVVETKYGLRIAYVVDVHPAPRIETDAPYEYKWIVQVVDNTEYLSRQAEERAFEETLQAVERERIREETMQAMSAHLPAGSKARAMFDQALARVSGQQVLENTHPVSAASVAPGTEGMACR